MTMNLFLLFSTTLLLLSSSYCSEAKVIELGVDNFAQTVKGQPWTVLLFYDGNHQQQGDDTSQQLMEGLDPLFLSNPNVTLAQLDIRRHPYYREHYYSAFSTSSLMEDYYADFPGDASNPLVVSYRSFMNVQGDLYFTARVCLMNDQYNVYESIDLDSLTSASVELQVAMMERWIQESLVANRKQSSANILVESQRTTEQEQEQVAKQYDNSFPFEEYFEQKLMDDVINSASSNHAADKDRALWETTENTTYYQQVKMTPESRRSNDAEVWWDGLSQIINAYLVWVEGYETLWDDARKAQEDEMTQFGTHLEELNANVRALMTSIFQNETYIPPTPMTQAKTVVDEDKQKVPHGLHGYLEELVFGAGRSPASVREYLHDVRDTMGATPQERKDARKTMDMSQFSLFERMKDYMKLVEDSDRNPNLYIYTLADLTSRWNNLLVQFADQLHASYATYLEQHPLERDEAGKIIYRRQSIQVLNMDDPEHYGLLTDYEAFHDKYTKTSTPVLLGNANMTPQHEYTLDYLKEQCGWMDVTRKVLESRPVGSSTTSSGSWGGLEDFELPDELLNDQRQGIFQRDSDDSDEDSDDDDDEGFADRSLTLEQFLVLQSKLDNLYLHDLSLSQNCGKILYNETLYDPYEQQKFQLPSIVASYDLFHRIPLYGFANTWPSLFIGKKGSNSKLHVDNGASAFWMYLAQGRKRWLITKPTARPFLYHLIQDFGVTAPDVLGIDKSGVDANEYLSKRFPLLHRAAEEMYEVIQEPGQLLYIPPGSPHAVENLEDSVGVALNLMPRDALARHVHDQIHFEREFGFTELALKYWLFEDKADIPLASDKNPLYMTFAEYKGQF